MLKYSIFAIVKETATQVIDIQSNLRDVVADWRKKLGAEFEVISVDLIPDKSEDGGLGISLEGTVDVVDGTHLCPHHYIDSLRPGGPAAQSNALRSGDELLQVRAYSLAKSQIYFEIFTYEKI